MSEQALQLARLSSFPKLSVRGESGRALSNRLRSCRIRFSRGVVQRGRLVLVEHCLINLAHVEFGLVGV